VTGPSGRRAPAPPPPAETEPGQDARARDDAAAAAPHQGGLASAAEAAAAAGAASVAEIPEITPPRPPVARPVAVAVCAAAGVVFGVLALWLALRGSAVPPADEQVHRWVVAHRGPGGVAVARAVRWAGTTTVVLPAVAVIGAVAGRGRDIVRRVGSGALLCLVASAGAYAEILINHAIARVRPPRADWAGPAAGSAFPSGHTTAATLAALCCGWAIAARVRPGWPRRAVWAGAAAYAVIVGWSRVWLGVHWPMDVLGGWLFSVAWVAGCVAAIQSIRWRPAAFRRAAGPASRAGQGRPG
jgi:undecaprenyl-diphosphatase